MENEVFSAMPDGLACISLKNKNIQGNSDEPDQDNAKSTSLTGFDSGYGQEFGWVTEVKGLNWNGSRAGFASWQGKSHPKLIVWGDQSYLSFILVLNMSLRKDRKKSFCFHKTIQV